jgi:cytochrome b
MNPARDRRRFSDNAPRPTAVQVWDLPTRLFHWLLVAFVIVSFVSGNIGGNAMQNHEWSGLTILALLLFRLAWGFVGGRHARFAEFLRGPRTVLRYAIGLLRGDAPRYPGHNPLGGWSILAMLTALCIQAVTGLFANDDIFTEGPLAVWVDKATSDWLTRIHRLNPDVIIALVCIHIFAVFFHWWVKRENLILPMVTGKKTGWADVQPSHANPVLAAAVALLAAAAVFLLLR